MIGWEIKIEIRVYAKRGQRRKAANADAARRPTEPHKLRQFVRD
jgi:hypothetical protein